MVPECSNKYPKHVLKMFPNMSPTDTKHQSKSIENPSKQFLDFDSILTSKTKLNPKWNQNLALGDHWAALWTKRAPKVPKRLPKPRK